MGMGLAIVKWPLHIQDAAALPLMARQVHEQLLDSYGAERYPIAKTMMRGSDRGFALDTTSNRLAKWIRPTSRPAWSDH
jgi:2-polyprenyl-6-methoxyphenol hydroxylase-like FAD-dependent oxidoreductase